VGLDTGPLADRRRKDGSILQLNWTGLYITLTRTVAAKMTLCLVGPKIVIGGPKVSLKLWPRKPALKLSTHSGFISHNFQPARVSQVLDRQNISNDNSILTGVFERNEQHLSAVERHIFIGLFVLPNSVG